MLAERVDRTGHGLQRAFLLTLLQHLTMAQATTKDTEGTQDVKPKEGAIAGLPNLVLAIEEPELYQHPNRQRHLAFILMRLASGAVPGVAKRTQVIYATHSPFFVGIDRVDQIRLLRKVPGDKMAPKITRIISTSMEHAAEILWKANGATGPKYTPETLRARLQAVMTPWMSEGFFADTVVLVEGEDDRAAILGAASRRGVNLDSVGISGLPCGGKTNMDRPAVIFGELGIRVYLVWDSDRGDPKAKAEDNQRLLRLMGAFVEDWPSGVYERFACFEVNLEETLKAELGEANYEAWLSQAETEFAIPKRKHVTKNPAAVAGILELAAGAGKRSATLEAIVDKVLNTVAAVAKGGDA
jgi:predicted ATP-dependent endonuclease of OLD family